MAALTVERLTKRFRGVTAVDDLSFAVREGSVTGFLGPNGAGKTTTLRCLLGLVAPTSGEARVLGRHYAELPAPIEVVGAVLEASSYHPGRSARDHLRVLCLAAGLPTQRAEAALAQVGLTEAAGRRVGGFSLGMRQRLGLAAALLGDPAVLILDEPANGLDPEGIHWLRGFLRHFAGTGRTVLISSHVLAEVAQTVDDVVILAYGRLVTAGPIATLTSGGGGGRVVARSPRVQALAERLAARGIASQPEPPDGLSVTGAPAAVVGETALEAGIVLHELSVQRADLEDVFLELTGGAGLR